MRLQFTILTLGLFITQAYSQAKNTLSATYAAGASNLTFFGRRQSDASYESQSGNIFGITYAQKLNRSFSFETGINFTNSNVKESSFGLGHTVNSYDNIKAVSIPALLKLSFLKYLYADFGFNISIQTNHTNYSLASNQSGIGCEGSAGAQYDLGKIKLFVAPYFQILSVGKFDRKASDEDLLNSGVKFGIGYNF
ncbi:MAG: hypothetical protein V4553_00745 [Bacteroidota bacterium]